jgi:membrane protease YdiL (CAAX protease family)
MTNWSPFDDLRARRLVVQVLLLMAAALWLHRRLGSRAGLGHEEWIGVVLAYCAAALLLFAHGWFAALDWRGLFGRWPAREELPLLAVIVPVDLLSFGAAIAVFIPLSYVAPQFAERFLLDPPALGGPNSVRQWVGVVLGAVVCAPFVEELLFRGFLLHRWARRWGTGPAVIASSALFAVLHGDWIGQFLFAVAMCALYLRTRTLWLPIAAHALSNLVIALTTLPDALTHATPEPETLDSLRGDWLVGLLSLVAGAALLAWYLGRWWSVGRLRATLAGPMPYDVYAASGTESPDSTSAS